MLIIRRFTCLAKEGRTHTVLAQTCHLIIVGYCTCPKDDPGWLSLSVNLDEELINLILRKRCLMAGIDHVGVYIVSRWGVQCLMLDYVDDYIVGWKSV